MRARRSGASRANSASTCRLVRGSGPNGRITREDVQGFVKRALAGGPATTVASLPAPGWQRCLPWPKVDFEKFGPIERMPLTRIQKLSGPNLHAIGC